MAIALDYSVIDTHVHITPWDMLNPAAAAVMEATQLTKLCSAPTGLALG